MVEEVIDGNGDDGGGGNEDGEGDDYEPLPGSRHCIEHFTTSSSFNHPAALVIIILQMSQALESKADHPLGDVVAQIRSKGTQEVLGNMLWEYL